MIYKITLPNSKYGHLMPPEDSILTDGKIFCVADGITRDPLKPKDISKLSIEQMIKHYPNPSGARIAADTFCETFFSTVKKVTPSEKSVKQGFIKANNKIAQLNKKNVKKVDYLVNDYWACVASAGVLTKNKLYWGALTDCGIIIYSKTGKKKFQTPNWMLDFEKYNKKFLCTSEKDFFDTNIRKLIRSQYRNNPVQEHSYGALTGEKEAEEYFHFGVGSVAKGDLIVFYSDGFDKTVIRKDFFKSIYKKTESLVDQAFIPYSLKLAHKNNTDYGRERSLIAVIV